MKIKKLSLMIIILLLNTCILAANDNSSFRNKTLPAPSVNIKNVEKDVEKKVYNAFMKLKKNLILKPAKQAVTNPEMINNFGIKKKNNIYNKNSIHAQKKEKKLTVRGRQNLNTYKLNIDNNISQKNKTEKKKSSFIHANQTANQISVLNPSVANSRKRNLNQTLMLTESKNSKVPDYIHVYPEQKAYVPISNVDINRIICERGKVVGLYFSKDKGVIAKAAGSSLYIRVVPDSFAFRHPFEMYIECGEKEYRETYSMIFMGERISTRTVILHSTKTKNIEKYFKKNTRLELITKLIKYSYKEDFPEDFKIKRVFEFINPISFSVRPDTASIIKYLQVDAGKWNVILYIVYAKKDITLTESQFVKENTIAVSVFDPILRKNHYSKVVVITEKEKPILLNYNKQ